MVFRWRFPKVPPGTDSAGQRVAYESMEERCNACTVYGGHEHPCCDLGPYVQRGKLCPRVVLDADNAIPFNILAHSTLEQDALFKEWLPLHLEALRLTPAQRLSVLERVFSVRTHPTVVDYQDAERERARAAAQPPRR